MIVMKFGGTSVGDAGRIMALARIVKNEKDNGPVVVVSALSGITDSLAEIVEAAAKGKPTAKLFEKIVERHFEIMKGLRVRKGAITREVGQLRNLLMGVSLLQDLTPRIMDNVLSFGERMSARIVAAYLDGQGLDAMAYDAYDIGMVTTSEFGNADAVDEAYPLIKGRLSGLRHIPIITGFIGKDREGSITTLGRGGSDYTATIIGAAINAKEIQIWTDVNGIMTADPRVVKTAKSIDAVSPDEASELAFLGAKVLHPRTILPAIKRNIPVRILNTFDPGHIGTIISRRAPSRNRVTSITCRKHIKVVNMSTPRMFEVHGFLRKVFEIFERHDVVVDMISTSEINVSVTIDGTQKTDKLMAELRGIAEIDIKEDRALVSLVGHNISYLPDVLGRMFTALEGIQIEMISSSMSEINQSFVVKNEHADEAVRRLHAAFFEG